MPQTLHPGIIDNLQLLSGVSEEEKNRLLREGKICWYARGQYLFHHNDPIDHLYIVCSGVIQLLRETPDGDKIAADIVTPGKTLCKSEILRHYNTHHQVSAVVVENAVLVEFPSSWLKEIATKNSIIALNILSTLSQYAHVVQVESEHKSSMTPAQQVACFLQRLCLMHELDTEGFELPYSKVLIASRLEMEPETFSRTFNVLKDHGIEINDNYVSFRNFDQISEFVYQRFTEECSTPRLSVIKGAR